MQVRGAACLAAAWLQVLIHSIACQRQVWLHELGLLQPFSVCVPQLAHGTGLVFSSTVGPPQRVGGCVPFSLHVLRTQIMLGWLVFQSDAHMVQGLVGLHEVCLDRA